MGAKPCVSQDTSLRHRVSQHDQIRKTGPEELTAIALSRYGVEHTAKQNACEALVSAAPGTCSTMHDPVAVFRDDGEPA